MTNTYREPISSQELVNKLEAIRTAVVITSNQTQEILDRYMLPGAAVRNVVGLRKELDKGALSLVAAIAVVEE